MFIRLPVKLLTLDLSLASLLRLTPSLLLKLFELFTFDELILFKKWFDDLLGELFRCDFGDELLNLSNLTGTLNLSLCMKFLEFIELLDELRGELDAGKFEAAILLLFKLLLF